VTRLGARVLEGRLVCFSAVGNDCCCCCWSLLEDDDDDMERIHEDMDVSSRRRCVDVFVTVRLNAFVWYHDGLLILDIKNT